MELHIVSCTRLRRIVAEKKESACTTPIFQFDQLSVLLLWNVSELKGFYDGNHTLECPSLRTIDVLHNPNMNLFKTSSTSNLERLGDENLQISMKQPVFIIEEVIPKLEKLRINGRDVNMILEAQNVETLFTKMTFLGLSNFMNEDEDATFPYRFLHNARSLEWLVIEWSSFEEIFQVERVVSEKIHTRLKKLTLFQLPKLQHICDEGYRIDPVLELLEWLHVRCCPSLKNLLPSSATFNHLTYLEITNCNGLINLITSSTAQSLAKLTTMTVEGCNSLEEIVKGDENADIAFTSLQILKLKCLPKLNKFCISNLKFPLLEEVVVRECPRMKIFSKGNISAPILRKVKIGEDNCEKWHWNGNLNDTVKNMFEDKVAFCKFEYLSLSEYPELKDLWYGQPHENVFRNLKSLVVQRCDFLSHVLFTSNLLQVLHGLEEVEVRDCDSLEALFDVKGMKSEEKLIKRSSCLKRLTLSGLPKLKQIWNDDPYDIISFENLCTVDVSECQSLLYIFPLSICQDLGQLEKLKIESCGVEEIVAAATMEEEGSMKFSFNFPQLTVFRLIKLMNIKNFYPGKHTLECPSLKVLSVYCCEGLKLFSFNNLDFQQADEVDKIQQALFSIDKVFPNLEKLRISEKDANMILQAENLETLFTKLTYLCLGEYEEATFPYWVLQNVSLERLVVEFSSFEKIFQDERVVNEKICTRLKKLTLCQLPKLQHICEEGYQGNPVLEFLELLHVDECPSLKNLLPPSSTFHHLTSLKIVNCNGLINLITSSTAKSLVQLTSLVISNCEMILDVVKTIDDQEAQEEEIIFQNLEQLELISMSSLRSFCYNGKHRFMFPSLTNLLVEECPQMEIFSSGVTIAPYLTSILVENKRRCWKGDLNTTIQHLFIEKKVAFCTSNHLNLSKYPELKDLWYGQPHENVFRNLKSLVVERCDFLSHLLFPSNLLQVLHGLEEVEVRDCDSLEAVFDVKGMKSKEIIEVKQSSGLKRLTLSGLPKLKQIWNDDPYDIISFGNLCTVDVSECQSLLYIFPLSICQDLGQLEKLEIKSCGVEEIVAAMEEEGSMKFSFNFPQLTVFRLIRLMNIKNFYPGKHTLECPSLKVLNVYRCEALKMFSFNNLDFQQADEVDKIQQALFSIDKLSPYLEELSISGTDAMSILNGCCQEMIFHKVGCLRLQCFDETPTSFLKHFHKIYPNLVTFVVCNSSFETLFPTKGHMSMQTSKQIRNLWLSELEKLNYIWEEDFPLDDPFLQQLEDLSVSNCPSLMSLVPRSTSFTNLTELEVENCKKLVYLITSTTAKSLVQLTSLTIRDCEMMLDVVKIDEQNADEEEIIFQNLEYLVFISMSSLRSFCYYGKHRFMFPSLTNLLVEECPQMEIFSSGVTIAPYLTSIEVENEREHWKGDLNTTIQHLFIEKKEVSHPDDK